MDFLRNCRDNIMKTNKRGGSSQESPDASFDIDEDNADDDASAYIRRAHHAGSWYSSNADDLDDLLSRFLADAEEDDGGREFDSNGGIPNGVPNACVSPHAGYSYSGRTAAYSYLALRKAMLKNPSLRTVVVLHPSHNVYVDGCALSGASIIKTPLGNLRVDNSLREQLLSTNKFGIMGRQVDEEEHSGEMQYPYIAKVINEVKKKVLQRSELQSSERRGGKRDCDDVRVLPIMVGSMKSIKEEAIGRLLSPYLSDRGIFTVISSDFCHWGRRFNYMPHPSKSDKIMNEVYEYIEYLDKKGMNLIEMQRPGAFANYLRKYSNTICGRHPISVWLHSLRESPLTHEVRFVSYAQSERARSTKDHSVSYASAVCQVAMFDG